MNKMWALECPNPLFNLLLRNENIQNFFILLVGKIDPTRLKSKSERDRKLSLLEQYGIYT